MKQDDLITQELRKFRKQASPLRRLASLWEDVRVAIYKFFNLDYSKVVGYPMTRREYKKWNKVGGVLYFKCDGYEVCKCFDGLSPHLPHLPIDSGWMSCERDSGHGFKCGVTTRACL